MGSTTVQVLSVVAAFLLAFSTGASAGEGKCEFAVEPISPGYFWDPTCEIGKVGCNADGKNVECRFCGGGNYSAPCPPTSCHFPGGEPSEPYYWDASCEMGMLGCWADGIHAKCRFCGKHPYTSISCPDGLAESPDGPAACAFVNEPETPHFWDPACRHGVYGCFADGVHEQCRFCGVGAYAEIPCPASVKCSFANEPTTPYYWEPECSNGKLGCMADGIHPQCRFCAKRPFEGIPCPGASAPPADVCTWPLHGEPVTPFYWEPSCEMGVLGCWADGIHAECRFCGDGVFQNITCPSSTAASGSTTTTLATHSTEPQASDSTTTLVAIRSTGAGMPQPRHEAIPAPAASAATARQEDGSSAEAAARTGAAEASSRAVARDIAYVVPDSEGDVSGSHTVMACWLGFLTAAGSASLA